MIFFKDYDDKDHFSSTSVVTVIVVCLNYYHKSFPNISLILALLVATA